jgi:hypothetical protein
MQRSYTGGRVTEGASLARLIEGLEDKGVGDECCFLGQCAILGGKQLHCFR